MGCAICGADATVKSHIIPKAFAHDVRDGASHVVAGSTVAKVARTSQGGFFSDTLLCSHHENLTAATDKYAVEFVRRVNEAWKDRSKRDALKIPNPQPELLRSFALLTIWREVHGAPGTRLSLGPYEDVVRRHVFDATVAPEWAIIVQRTNFVIEKQGAADFNLHPYRVRFAGLSGWMFTVAGVCFFVVMDRRGLPTMFEDWRADRHDLAVVTVSEPLPFTEVGALRGILASLAARSRTR